LCLHPFYKDYLTQKCKNAKMQKCKNAKMQKAKSKNAKMQKKIDVRKVI
tara:strand:- start:1667 stop:1813 length:147 start_codon:yes stop_codon:yes gene_type:complete